MVCVCVCVCVCAIGRLHVDRVQSDRQRIGGTRLAWQPAWRTDDDYDRQRDSTNWNHQHSSAVDFSAARCWLAASSSSSLSSAAAAAAVVCQVRTQLLTGQRRRSWLQHQDWTWRARWALEIKWRSADSCCWLIHDPCIGYSHLLQ